MKALEAIEAGPGLAPQLVPPGAAAASFAAFTSPHRAPAARNSRALRRLRCPLTETCGELRGGAGGEPVKAAKAVRSPAGGHVRVSGHVRVIEKQ